MNGKNINKGMVLRVTDPGLLELTGGIVQGMSGSPILQNGRIVGAVTHVFVNNPEKGYGIFIEDDALEFGNAGRKNRKETGKETAAACGLPFSW